MSNPSAIFLSQHGQVAGSCVLITQEGTRPLVEIQALVDAMVPAPRRLSSAPWSRRGWPCCWVLHRHAGIVCFDQDVR